MVALPLSLLAVGLAWIVVMLSPPPAPDKPLSGGDLLLTLVASFLFVFGLHGALTV